MARRKKRVISTPKRKPQNLDHIPDVSGTVDELGGSLKEERSFNKSTKVPPPFKGAELSPYITRNEFGLTYKALAVAAAIFLSVGVPAVWFSSRINSSVENLEKDVGNLQEKSESLIKDNISNKNKITVLEKEVEEITKNNGSKEKK